jgi:hypothetical protein
MASITPAQVEFESLLIRLLSADNEERKAAEATLGVHKTNDPNGLVVALVSALRNPATPVPSRQMACSVLRPLLIKRDGSVWPALPEQTRGYVQRELLLAIECERAPPVIRKVLSCVADLGSYLRDKGGWPELLPFVFRCTGSADATQRESALELFSQLAILFGSAVFRPHFAVIRTVLQQGLTDAASFSVRLAALSATASFLQIMEKQDDQQLNQFQALLPHMLECITVAIQHDQHDSA